MWQNVATVGSQSTLAVDVHCSLCHPLAEVSKLLDRETAWIWFSTLSSIEGSALRRLLDKRDDILSLRGVVPDDFLSGKPDEWRPSDAPFRDSIRGQRIGYGSEDDLKLGIGKPKS